MKPDPGRLLQKHRAPADLLDRALAPRPASALGWTRALAAAAVFILGVGVGVTASQLTSEPDVAASSASVAPTGAVRLVVHAPDADSVTVAGTWNDWNAEAQRLQRDDDGLFYIDLELPRGHHEYMFVIDGNEWVTDQLARLHRDDGFGNRNAVLEI